MGMTVVPTHEPGVRAEWPGEGTMTVRVEFRSREQRGYVLFSQTTIGLLHSFRHVQKELAAGQNIWYVSVPGIVLAHG